jgi:hypothetical protein
MIVGQRVAQLLHAPEIFGQSHLTGNDRRKVEAALASLEIEHALTINGLPALGVGTIVEEIDI